MPWCQVHFDDLNGRGHVLRRFLGRLPSLDDKLEVDGEIYRVRTVVPLPGAYERSFRHAAIIFCQRIASGGEAGAGDAFDDLD